MSVFTETVKTIIKSRGLKQKYIAEKMGITERKLCDILNGRKVIDVHILLSLCKALDVEPNELLGYSQTG